METKTNLQSLGSLNRLQKRTLIETYCNIANLLPAHKRILFHLYYRYGVSTVEISQLLMVHQTTVARRIGRIAGELTDLLQGKNIGPDNERQIFIPMGLSKERS
jgi:DNA-directed RNA polymerase specialized sigma24 family protein